MRFLAALVLCVAAGKADASGFSASSFGAPSLFRPLSGDAVLIAAISGSLRSGVDNSNDLGTSSFRFRHLNLGGQGLYSYTGSLVNDVTQDVIRTRPSAAISAFYRPFASYATTAAVTPATWIDQAVTFGGVAYDFGSWNLVGTTGAAQVLLGKETGFDFFDLASTVDVDLFCTTTGSFIDAGPIYGVSMNEGASGGYGRVTSAGDFHFVSGFSQGSAIDAGPTYSGMQISGKGLLIMQGTGAGTAQVKINSTGTGGVLITSVNQAKLQSAGGGNTDLRNLSGTGNVTVVNSGTGFLQLESTASFTTVKGTTATLAGTAGQAVVAALGSNSVRFGPGNALVLPSDTAGNLNDNAIDLGSAANRWRTGRFGTSVVVGATTTYGDGTITTSGGAGVTVDGNATKSRSTYGPWTMVNLAASQTNINLDIPTSAILPTAAARIKMPFAGRIKAISVSGSAARTAGTATFTVFKNNATVSGAPSLVIDGTNTQRHQVSTGTATFVAGDDLQVVATTDGSWSPVSTEYVVMIVVEWTS